MSRFPGLLPRYFLRDFDMVPVVPIVTGNDGFGCLVVSILATGTRVRGFKPLDFSGVRKILSMPSFGGEVK